MHFMTKLTRPYESKSIMVSLNIQEFLVLESALYPMIGIISKMSYMSIKKVEFQQTIKSLNTHNLVLVDYYHFCFIFVNCQLGCCRINPVKTSTRVTSM